LEVLKPGVDCINPNVKKVVENVVICEDGRYYVNLIGMRFTWGGAWKPTFLCVPSQKGLLDEWPHLHSAAFTCPSTSTR
jgi:hypothetical protein